jgi:serine/threonine protein kinase
MESEPNYPEQPVLARHDQYGVEAKITQEVGPDSSADSTPSNDLELPKTVALPTSVHDETGSQDRLELYEILGEEARGGMGIVFRARHAVLDRVVALKMMRPDSCFWPQDQVRFKREMRVTAQLDHPNILPIYDIGWLDDKPFYTMPYVPGGSLAKHRNRFVENPHKTLELMVRVARAVHHAHERGIIHRDLKPANILLDNDDTPFVTDFGLARFREDNVELTETGAALGTPGYMAPEQAAGKIKQIGPSTDVWALGVILYELLAGRRPFLGENAEDVKEKIRTESYQPLRKANPRLNDDFDRVVSKCLEKDPSRRYASACALADDLELLLRGELQGRPSNRPHRAIQFILKRYFLSLSLASFFIALFISGLIVVRGFHTPSESAEPGASGPESLSDRKPPPPLILLERGKPVSDLHWLAGAKDSNANHDASKSAFSYSTTNLSLLQLLAAPPWPHYRLEASIHDDGCSPFGEAGIFFAYSHHTLPSGPYHVFWRLGFHERGRRRANEVDLLLWGLHESPPQALDGGIPFDGPAFRFVQLPNGPTPIREVAVEVDADEVRAYWEGKCIRKASSQQLQERRRRLLMNPPNGVEQPIPEGPLGIYVQSGTASFSSVVIKPLP